MNPEEPRDPAPTGEPGGSPRRQPSAASLPAPVTLGGPPLVVVGHFDCNTGQVTPARPRAGQTVVCAIESLQVDPDPDPEPELGAVPMQHLPVQPATLHLPPLSETIPPAPAAAMPRRPLPRRRRLRSIVLTVPVAAGLTLVTGRLVDRARSAPDEPAGHETVSAVVQPAFAPPPPRPAAPSIEQVDAPAPVLLPRDDAPRYLVRGVVAPDTLNVRARPDPHSAAVTRIPADARGIVATGKRRQIGASAWWEVAYDGHRGWVNGRFLSPDPRR
jgi:hypothetical protein